MKKTQIVNFAVRNSSTIGKPPSVHCYPIGFYLSIYYC